jgi:hypothetical protein
MGIVQDSNISGNLKVGVSKTVLRNDGTEALPVWNPTAGGNGAYFGSGLWHFVPSTTISTLLMIQNRMYLMPFEVKKPQAFDQIGYEVATTPGDATVVCRLGIYKATTALPTSLVADLGTVAGNDSTGAKTLAIASALQTLQPALYYLAIVAQTGATMPTIRSCGGVTVPMTPTNALNDSSLRLGFQQDNVTGALPAIGTLATPSANARIALRAV